MSEALKYVIKLVNNWAKKYTNKYQIQMKYPRIGNVTVISFGFEF